MLGLKKLRSPLTSFVGSSSSGGFAKLLYASRNSSTNRRQDSYYNDNDITLDDIVRVTSRGDDRLTGRVKFFDRRRGFGFIEPYEDCQRFPDKNFFVHRKALLPLGFVSDREYAERNINNMRTYLEDGEDVEFELREYADSVHAVNVTGPKGGRLRVWVGPSHGM